MQLQTSSSLLAVAQGAKCLTIGCRRVDADVSKAAFLIGASTGLEMDASGRIVR